jgi:hypothetical protein
MPQGDEITEVLDAFKEKEREMDPFTDVLDPWLFLFHVSDTGYWGPRHLQKQQWIHDICKNSK